MASPDPGGMPRAPRRWNPLTLAWLASVWIAGLLNWPLWRALWALPEVAGVHGKLFIAACGLMVASLTALVLTLAAWRPTIKPVIGLFLVSAAVGAHFMGAYGVGIDRGMMVNLLQTDVREVRDLLNLRLFAGVLLLAIVPLAWLARVRLQRLSASRQALRNAAGLAVAALLFAALLMAFFADMASTMRGHKSIRYLINPLNSFYALADIGLRRKGAPAGPPAIVAADARLTEHPGALPPLLLLVVGETARADHFSLNGYTRQTNPELARLDVFSFRDVTSCGTSTAASLPCMFSLLGKKGYESQAVPHENLLDALHRAGLAVMWIDNQSGCKDQCSRVPHVRADDLPAPLAMPPDLCDGGECFDEALVTHLDARVAALPLDRRERGIVLVLHQMGSHGPAYWKRSPPSRKPFEPECRTNELSRCDPQALIDAYDNSIAYTDHVLAQAIAWLKTRASDHATALLYVSDHGESLGEKNLYLHGVPFAFAPREQTHVPMILWLSPQLTQQSRLDLGCLGQRLDEPLSHDNLPPTVLGLTGVQTQAYRPALDVMAPCREVR